MGSVYHDFVLLPGDGVRTKAEPGLHQVARGNDFIGNRLDFEGRINMAMDFFYARQRDPRHYEILINTDPSSMGETPLCLAVRYGNLPMVVTLVNIGGDIDASRCGKGHTPISLSNSIGSNASNRSSEYRAIRSFLKSNEALKMLRASSPIFNTPDTLEQYTRALLRKVGGRKRHQKTRRARKAKATRRHR